jgi:hypothetical protein
VAADLCHYPASCRGRGGAGAPLALPTPSPTPQKGEAAPGETVCPAARRHSPLHHFCWWNKFVANPIKKFGYVGKGRTAMALLKHEIMDKILLRRTKLQCADVLALPPRCAPAPRACTAQGLHGWRAGAPDTQGRRPPPQRARVSGPAKHRACTGRVLHRVGSQGLGAPGIQGPRPPPRHREPAPPQLLSGRSSPPCKLTDASPPSRPPYPHRTRTRSPRATRVRALAGR